MATTAKSTLLVHDDLTDGAAPMPAELWIEGDRVHIRNKVIHISVYDEDILRSFENDILEKILQEDEWER